MNKPVYKEELPVFSVRSMSRYIDYACYLVLAIVVFVAASTFGVAYLDYIERHEEYAEKIDTNREFHRAHCSDTGRLTKFPQLKDACHDSKHAAYDDPSKRALRDVLARWSVCDASGCDTFLDRFGRYFSIAALALALVIGAWCLALVYRVSARRELERLPGAFRRN